MKLKQVFNSLDCIAIVKELQSIEGSRVNKIYDIDNKTYLFKLNKPNSEKTVLLIESGVRLHLTKCDWPKNSAPSGFTMKLRKHINNKRIAYIKQVGRDRIIDIQFGSGEVAFHIILELYNRGNIILTDYNFMIVSLIRSYVDGDSFNFAVHEKYPIENFKDKTLSTGGDIHEIVMSSKKNISIKKALLPKVDLGPSLLEHTLRKAGIDPETKVKLFSEEVLKNIEKELHKANEFLVNFNDNESKGYITFEKEDKDGEDLLHMIEFNPCLFVQHENLENKCFESFNDAVDEYFSKIENEKIQYKILGHEKEAMKKVNKIREDQHSRLEKLSAKQQNNIMKAEVIMNNASIVDDAINTMRAAIATQMSWKNIKDLVEEATRNNNVVASLISAIKLEFNQISMRLTDPYEEDEEKKHIEVDLDLSLSAHANAKRYYEDKKYAALKEKKTLQSQKKALKSAELKARETLKTIKIQTAISKTRKIYWFEKFYWFISSENYLIIGGRDQKQNEIIVKRYMKPGDLYVHADLQGASSVIIKNPSAKPVPPRTLDEAGILAVCFSNAWSSKILFNAWWVYHNQVSKTAPTGEYLVTGSFMIRGQKHYLLPQHLQLGFSFLFKVDDSCIHKHVNERKVKTSEENCLQKDSLNQVSETDATLTEVDENRISDEENPQQSLFTPEIEPSNNELTESISFDVSLDENKLNDLETSLNLQTESEDNNSDHDIGNEEIEIDSVIPKKTSNTKKKQFDHRINCEQPGTVRNQSKSKEKKQNEETLKNNKYKRGQKSKIKKIKEKYKDQDEEEKQLRMLILKSAGTPKSTDQKQSKTNKKSEKNNPSKNKALDSRNSVPAKIEGAAPDSNINNNADIKRDITHKNNQSDEEDETVREADELNMLSSLTGQPHEDDEIMFALPIVAPYTAVLNNKYKVKMIPGMTKRGKAARTALEAFLRSKDCSSREKDVMKGVSDQLITRNFPGKVKILTPQGTKK